MHLARGPYVMHGNLMGCQHNPGQHVFLKQLVRNSLLLSCHDAVKSWLQGELILLVGSSSQQHLVPFLLQCHHMPFVVGVCNVLTSTEIC